MNIIIKKKKTPAANIFTKYYLIILAIFVLGNLIDNFINILTLTTMLYLEVSTEFAQLTCDETNFTIDTIDVCRSHLL